MYRFLGSGHTNGRRWESIMNYIVRFLSDGIVIVSAVIWIVPLILRGYVSITVGVIALVAIVFFRALGRGLGGNIGRLVRLVFGIGVPAASILTWAIILSGGDWGDIVRALGGLGAICLAIGGLYIMFFGAFSSRRKR